MTKLDDAQRLAEIERLLNDPDVAMEPSRVWSLLAEMSGHADSESAVHARSEESRSAAMRNSRFPSGPVMGLSAIPSTVQPG